MENYINTTSKRITYMSKSSMKDEMADTSHSVNNKCYVKLTVTSETKRMVLSCIPDFLEHHPEVKGMKITENFIVMQIADHYKKSP